MNDDIQEKAGSENSSANAASDTEENSSTNAQEKEKKSESGGLTELEKRLDRAEQLLIQERNRRVFERALSHAGFRTDRIEAAYKLAGLDSSNELIDEKRASEIAERILADFPEFGAKAKLLSTDQSAPGGVKSRAAASGDALSLLKAMRRG